MKRILSLLVVCLSFASQAQKSLDQSSIYFALRNKITPEVSSFLTSDTVYDNLKNTYLKMASGLEFYNYDEIPSTLKKAFLDPVAYGIQTELSEMFLVAPDSQTTSRILVYYIKDFNLFKEKISKDPSSNFEKKDGIFEVYKNTTFIKGNKLVFIYSEERQNKNRYSYTNTDVIGRHNRLEAQRQEYSLYCTEEVYNEAIAIPLHLRKDPDNPDMPNATIEQIKKAKKQETNSYYSSESEAEYASPEEKEMYEAEINKEENNYLESDNSKDPLSYYKGINKKYAYEAEEDYEMEAMETVEETETEVIAEAKEAYDYETEYEEYTYEEEPYDEYASLSKKDAKKLKKLKKKENKIWEKNATEWESDSYDYSEDYVNDEDNVEEYVVENYYYIPYYKPYSLFNNKEYAAPFLESNLKININQKSYKDFTSSSATTSFWVNQDAITQLFYGAIIEELINKNNISSKQKNEFLKDCALLFELNFDPKAKHLATMKGYGNPKYLAEIKSVFNTSIPSNWIANVPKDAPIMAAMAYDNAKLVKFYKDYLLSSFTSSSDTLFKEILNLVEIAIDEDALAKISNGKSLFFIDGSNTYTKYFVDYSYDDEYNYTEKSDSSTQTVPSFAYFVGNDDQSAINSVLKIVQYFGYTKPENGIYTMFSKSYKESSFDINRANEHIYLMLINNAMVISNDIELLKKISTNKKTSDPVLAKQLEQNKILFTANASDLISTLSKTDFGKNEEMIKFLNQFKTLQIKGLDFDSEKFTISTTFEAANSKENQVMNLMKLFGVY